MSNPAPLQGPELLNQTHDLSSFDCGKALLNTFLKRFALINQLSASARTYVIHRGSKVLGYYSLAAAAVEPAAAPIRVSKGLGQYPIPRHCWRVWPSTTLSRAGGWARRC